MDDFSTFEVVKAFGLKYQTLRDWLDKGFLKPQVQAKGRDSRTRFSRVDLYLLRLFMYLVERGFRREEAAITVAAIRQTSGKLRDQLLNSLYIYFPRNADHPTDIFPGFHPKDLGPEIKLSMSDSKQSYDEILVLNFSKLRKHVDSLLE
jgi:hypothetical protein